MLEQKCDYFEIYYTIRVKVISVNLDKEKSNTMKVDTEHQKKDI